MTNSPTMPIGGDFFPALGDRITSLQNELGGEVQVNWLGQRRVVGNETLDSYAQELYSIWCNTIDNAEAAQKGVKPYAETLNGIYSQLRAHYERTDAQCSSNWFKWLIVWFVENVFKLQFTEARNFNRTGALPGQRRVNYFGAFSFPAVTHDEAPGSGWPVNMPDTYYNSFGDFSMAAQRSRE